MGPLKSGAAALGVSLDDSQVEQFRLYHRELVSWNSRTNLTAVIEWSEVRTRHVLDSLSAAAAIPEDILRGGVAVDVGSGAGFPGLALKIAFPDLDVTLIDSTSKKTAFLRHVSRQLGLDGVVVLTGRAEDLAHRSDLREGFDIVLSRAVARLPVLAELTLPFCRVGGLTVLHKGAGARDEVADARFAIDSLGAAVKEVRVVRVEGGSRRAMLVVLDKLRATLPHYPRRPGIPAKRPITGHHD